MTVFFVSPGWGDVLETARTLVVNVNEVLEIFCLFNVRYFHMSSTTLRGVLGTPTALVA